MKIYEVGGCVRDSLMGIVPKDYDYVVVGSTPEEMISLGYQKVGAAFPVFLHPETNAEYALARTERKVGNGYNGFECIFTPDVTLDEDLSRRDLTCNSIARDIETGEIIDPFNGQVDIKNKILRHTSDAFADDPLRVIRLARFYARMSGFVIDKKTCEIASRVVDSGEMDHITGERYWAEMMKVFSDDDCDIDMFFCCLHNFGVLRKALYFKLLLGDFSSIIIDPSFAEKCSKISGVASPELRAALFVAMFENIKHNGSYCSVRALPSRVSTLVKNYRKIKSCFYTAEEIYDVIAVTRSVNENTPAFMDLLSCMRIDGRRDYKLLDGARILVNQVKADTYMHLSGVEIGKAMKEERIRVISEIRE